MIVLIGIISILSFQYIKIGEVMAKKEKSLELAKLEAKKKNYQLAKKILSSLKGEDVTKLLQEIEIEQFVDDASKMLESKNYTRALELIDKAAYSAKSLEKNNDYQDKIVKLKNKILPLEVQRQIEIARKIAKEGEYTRALEILVSVDYINTDSKIKENIAQLKNKYSVLQEKKEKKKKKSEGVSIGMTQDDVLDSSWGKPKKINRTTTEFGTSEQWVYENYNYLYFEDGILVSIQNWSNPLRWRKVW